MPKCSIIGCGSKNSTNQQRLTLHRLPRCEYKKKKWLEAIRMENIRPNTKDIFICSLHFDEKAINRTLDIVRLRDDAIPSASLLPTANQRNSALTENRLDLDPFVEDQDAPAVDPLEIAISYIHQTPTPDMKDKPSEVTILKEKCNNLRKKVRRLNETIRRQKKKIDNLTTIVKDFQNRSLVNDDR